MQENNNFQTIISTWRRMSGEQLDSSVVSMSGDSPDYDPFKKKEEETNLLVPERTKPPLASIAGAEAAAAAVDVCMPDNERDDKKEFCKHDKEEKEGAGDTNDKNSKSDNDYLENNENIGSKSPQNKWEADKVGDKVDAVYLRPPPPHKARSTTSTAEEEDCGIKCLYYTLQCCDCVLM